MTERGKLFFAKKKKKKSCVGSHHRNNLFRPESSIDARKIR